VPAIPSSPPPQANSGGVTAAVIPVPDKPSASARPRLRTNHKFSNCVQVTAQRSHADDGKQKESGVQRPYRTSDLRGGEVAQRHRDQRHQGDALDAEAQVEPAHKLQANHGAAEQEADRRLQGRTLPTELLLQGDDEHPEAVQRAALMLIMTPAIASSRMRQPCLNSAKSIAAPFLVPTMLVSFEVVGSSAPDSVAGGAATKQLAPAQGLMMRLRRVPMPSTSSSIRSPGFR
jgi:hypothetical protein